MHQALSACTVRIVSGRQLSPSLCAEWTALQRSNPALLSPYFCPEFTQLVASIRTDVQVAVIEKAQQLVAILPFQRGQFGAARPVAGRLTDFQGLISAADFQFDPLELLKKCKLRSFFFDHMLSSQVAFAPFIWTSSSSPYLDLSQGYAAYEAGRRAENNELTAVGRKLRKMERELGDVRFVYHSASRDDLQTLMRWKSEQYTRTGLRDLFQFDWIRQLIHDLHDRQTPELAGKLACLYSGERLIAAHFGMSSHNVLHWWFPAYDRELYIYSPGMSLIQLTAKDCHLHGINRIDLGKGDEEYKFRIASAIDQVGEGSVDLNVGTRVFRKTWQLTRDWVKASPLQSTVEAPLRWIRKARDWFSFK